MKGGGLISSTLLKLFEGLARKSISKDILLALYPSEFFGLVFLDDFTTLTPETTPGGGGGEMCPAKIVLTECVKAVWFCGLQRHKQDSETRFEDTSRYNCDKLQTKIS